MMVVRTESGTVETERLALSRPTVDDLDELFAIHSDPRVWTHYPSLCVTDPAQTRSMIERFDEGWRDVGLDCWTVRERGRGRSAVIGWGGCMARPEFWNLGYRLSPAVQGRGYATELAVEALRRAREVAPDKPVIAKLVEHNVASRRVAEKLGMVLAYRAYDRGNPDPDAVRLVYADRTLGAGQLAAVVG